jgi:hypothetical protein
MATREFHGTLRNTTDQEARLEKFDCDSGEFSINPEAGAKKIPPGGEGKFASESDGIMTGTSGWCRWSVEAFWPENHFEYIQINWGIPYVGAPNIAYGISYSHPDDSWKVNRTPYYEIGISAWNGHHEVEFLEDLPYLAGAFLVLPATWFLDIQIPPTRPHIQFTLRKRQNNGQIASPLIGTVAPPDRNAILTNTFRSRADHAGRLGFTGAIPNFYFADRPAGAQVGGTIFVQGPGVVWRDVPVEELQNAPFEDFGACMRATQDYAVRNGFVGGFPNFHRASRNGIEVRGTILLSAEVAEWRDVPLMALGSPALDDVEQRFRATQDYASREGFVGGFPTMYHSAGGRFEMRGNPRCGTILLKTGQAEWRDVETRGPIK